MRAFQVFLIFIGKALLLLLGLLLVLGGGTCITGGFNSAGALGLAMLIPGLGMLFLVFRKSGNAGQQTDSGRPSEEEN